MDEELKDVVPETVEESPQAVALGFTTKEELLQILTDIKGEMMNLQTQLDALVPASPEVPENAEGNPDDINVNGAVTDDDLDRLFAER